MQPQACSILYLFWFRMCQYQFGLQPALTGHTRQHALLLKSICLLNESADAQAPRGACCPFRRTGHSSIFASSRQKSPNACRIGCRWHTKAGSSASSYLDVAVWKEQTCKELSQSKKASTSFPQKNAFCSCENRTALTWCLRKKSDSEMCLNHGFVSCLHQFCVFKQRIH